MKEEETILKWIVKEMLSMQIYPHNLGHCKNKYKVKKYKKWFSQHNKKHSFKKGKSQWEEEVR